MKNTNKTILVTTGLKETWGKGFDNIIFLGSWCKSYANKDYMQSSQSKIIKYHWSSSTKLRNDYRYLEALFERSLIELASSLNAYHNKNHSLRYWRIILGPWLLSFVSVIWDRWESLRVAFEREKFDLTISIPLEAERLIPINFKNWDKLIIDDLWNHHLFNKIIEFNYKDRVKVETLAFGGSYELNSINQTEFNFKQKLINLVDWIFGKFQKNYKVILVSSYFSLPNLVRLSLKLRQLPRVYSIFFQNIELDENLKTKRDLKFNIEPTNLFEEFLTENITEQIPIVYLEGYKTYLKKISKIDFNSQIIFTANAHLSNDIFNLWCAKKVEEDAKLFISQHGGGLKSEMTVFRHQEKIADKMIVWHKPLEGSHVQLAANKLIKIQQKKLKRKELTIFGYEAKIYTNRAQSGPKAEGVKDDFLQKMKFCNELSSEVNEYLRVRSSSHGPGFFNSGLRYREALGVDKISTHSSLYEALKYSKVVVCTYPQTTFSEAMRSGIPTILIYSEHLWEFEQSFHSLIKQLKENKIIFTCPKEAAKHINSIWENPNLWWKDIGVSEARQNYIDLCCKKSDDWVSEWTTFFGAS